ncbi:putative membrane protein [Natronospira proteinivora]|uniref:Membrane protein n=1 Tax=Natronospira proteinivora TaxID=1807133 RepID=A0ABT1G4E8_9GAMM|nr:DUF2069 domain-containing protein [Natronospira proteinivora]MCP1726167.1 putative membrane protein [Natronospira proteinivora]
MISLKRAKLTCTAIAFILAATWAMGYGWWHPLAEQPLLWAAIGALPLLLLIPGVLQDKTLPTAVMGFLALFYMAHGFTEVMANPEIRVLSTLIALLALGLFLSAGHTLRVQSVLRRSQ